MKKTLLILVLLSAAAPRAARAAEAPAAVLFPAAFSVEHQLVQTDPSGDSFRAQPVVDTYVGSTLVSVRPGGSRVIVDFGRRTVTDVSVEKSTYWTLSFSQMGELSRRLAKADERPSASSAGSGRASNVASAGDIRVEEVTGGRSGLVTVDGPVLRAGARHFRASSVSSGASADVWVDGSVRMSTAALDALEAFESDALGAGSGSVTPARLVAAARRAAGGAVPVYAKRPLSAAGGSVEDVVTTLTPLPSVPQKLLAVGEGFRRVASPLEEMVAFAEDEASRDSSRLVK